MFTDVATPEKEHCGGQEHESQASRTAKHIDYDCSVFAGLGIVMIAEEQNLIHGRANAVMRRLDETKLEVFRLILDAVEIAAEAAFRRKQHNAAGVDKHFVDGIPTVMKADSLHDGSDGFRIAYQEMPALALRLARVAVRGMVALCRGLFGGIRWIETDRNDFEIAARLQREWAQTPLRRH